MQAEITFPQYATSAAEDSNNVAFSQSLMKIITVPPICSRCEVSHLLPF